jgi:hypothetical protein
VQDNSPNHHIFFAVLIAPIDELRTNERCWDFKIRYKHKETRGVGAGLKVIEMTPPTSVSANVFMFESMWCTKNE